jgi:DNA-binding helix-hairpin-helix protein with protein kinase domain
MEFTRGKRIRLENGSEITIERTFGEGGQGYVYKASHNNGAAALKWYKPSYLKSLDKQGNLHYFKDNLKVNIRTGAPGSGFIWPKAITADAEGSFGYIMDVRPDGYAGFEDVYLKRSEFSSFKASIDCAVNMVIAFRALHIKGFFYLDLNDGNFFINPKTGEILVCDNDNVTADPKFNIGKPGYVAPELVRGEKGVMSSQVTDYHSLAVVLFKLLIRHDPMEGVKFVTAGCLSPKKQYELYGSNPVFIYDPNNDSNRPVNGLHLNALNLWGVYPEYLRGAFVKTFCDGLREPGKRTTELEWQKILLQIRDNIITCPCGKDIYMHGRPANEKIDCSCGRTHRYPNTIKIDRYSIMLFPGNAIYDFHLDAKGDINTRACSVVASKSDPNRWGLKNHSSVTWRVVKANGETDQVQKDGIAVIEKGVKIEFTGALSAVIE